MHGVRSRRSRPFASLARSPTKQVQKHSAVDLGRAGRKPAAEGAGKEDEASGQFAESKGEDPGPSAGSSPNSHSAPWPKAGAKARGVGAAAPWQAAAHRRLHAETR
jgi:hypothetical protein